MCSLSDFARDFADEGLGKLSKHAVYEITTLPFVGAFFDWLYDWFSEYRLKAAGREDILEKVHSHQAKIQELEETECEDECEVDWDQLAVPKFSKMSPGR
ncbi:hypothetical protein AK812_SmicGene10482 [Symbiodinium microadriaticum]|uniref:Uncharacterized protein n=1 Tax=Symbiodinium microadriaticum TaxID=2951 RepID=A0A1Q9EFJ8_SYMMI|nr:hypothetical protein AK812_SmicGene10482 [Symbiodinium microadriaticum]CAE7201803.1 unnamed protein product [Symbiodinium microadriaticum]